MPGWVWILLVLFMIAMLVSGAVYAIIHAIRAGKTVGQVGESVGRHMPQPVDKDARPRESTGPFFAQPLNKASERYSQAHADLLRRKNYKRDRHASAWARWKHFNR